MARHSSTLSWSLAEEGEQQAGGGEHLMIDALLRRFESRAIGGQSASTLATLSAGIVMRGDELYASYYTSPLDRDYTWILGMFRPWNIRMARIDLRALEELATSQLPTRA